MFARLIIFSISLGLLTILAQNPCHLHMSCGECIKDSRGCKWCGMTPFNGTYRCHPSNNTIMGCPDLFIEDPKSEMKRMQNDDSSIKGNNIKQIEPQKYSVNLRPGHSKDFEFSFKGAENYPADLYFLIDVSVSMKKVKKNIASASKRIYNELNRITNDVNLGLGTFIDKNALPYVSEINSTTAYSFKNKLKLTKDVNKFEEVLNGTPVGTNYDTPEGGLDGLAQAIVCLNEIGWRDRSRKIIVFFTDAPSHTAGDGKWAGIVNPYDGQCYTKNGIYENELEMDYPSTDIINKLASERDVTIIFIAKRDSMKHYQNLIRGAKSLPYDIQGKTVQFDKGQLENALTKIYLEITENIQLQVHLAFEDRKYVKISFDPNCEIDKNVDCKVNRTEPKTIRGNIKLLEYYDVDHIDADISINGINEKLILSVDVIKDCDCKTNKSKIDYNSKFCSSGGDLACGICECANNRYGETCACTKNENGEGDNSTCIAEGAKELCNGRGFCECGTCHCLDGFKGKFCDCNTKGCINECNGHGNCECGVCVCKDGWTGDACDCSLASCEKDGRVCNGRGQCVCGKCKCDPIMTQWDARYSQNQQDCTFLPCPECHTNQCRLLEACALCHHNQKKDCSVCDPLIIVNTTNILSNTNDTSVHTCENVKVDITCYTRYMYRYREEYGIELYVQTDGNCAESFIIFGSIFLATLILIGIGTLIAWKLLRDARDRREYETFVREHADDADGVCQSDIYQPPTTTFKNPIFRKRSVDFR